jgi:hypothetical protein
MKDEWVYDAARNLIYRKRDWLTDEEVEELRINEAIENAWWKENKKKDKLDDELDDENEE